MKIYITKYALTKGIFEAEANTPSASGIIVVPSKTSFNAYYGIGEYHFTKEEALRKAIDMQYRKIESVKKQLKKLENMKFTIKEI